MAEPAHKMTFTVSTRRIDAHGSLDRCKEATLTLDTDVAGRADAFNPAELLLAALSACGTVFNTVAPGTQLSGTLGRAG